MLSSELKVKVQRDGAKAICYLPVLMRVLMPYELQVPLGTVPISRVTPGGNKPRGDMWSPSMQGALSSLTSEDAMSLIFPRLAFKGVAYAGMEWGCRVGKCEDDAREYSFAASWGIQTHVPADPTVHRNMGSRAGQGPYG